MLLPLQPHAEEVAPEGALTAGSLFARLRLGGMAAYGIKSKIDHVGGDIDVPPLVFPDGDISYFFTDHIAIEGQTGLALSKIVARNTLIGDFAIGKTWSVPLMLTMQYHFLPQRRLNPFLGLGGYASWYFGEKPAGGLVRDLRVDPQYGVVLQAGADYHVSGNWHATFGIRNIILPSHKMHGSGGNASVGLNVLTVGAGIGYRF